MSEQIVTKSEGEVEFESMVAVHQELSATTCPPKYQDLTTTSAKIRAMNKDGYTTGNIAKLLGIRYQHARNVIKNPGKKQQA